jgi:type IV pilus assembly protein PilW
MNPSFAQRVSPFIGIRRQSGLTLVELMVAITISLIVLAALTAMYVTSMRARDEVQRANQQIENGRYAMQVLADDLQMAGYFAGFLPAAPAHIPDPCATNPAAPASPVTVADVLGTHVQGYDNGAGISASCNTVLTDRRANTDVVAIRRLSSCVAGTASCNDIAGELYFQLSLCNQEIDAGNLYRLSTTTWNLRQRDCTTAAVKRRFMTHVYYVANNNQPGDGIPTLKRAELRGSAFVIVPIAEGIDNLQLEYGIDSAGNDGVPDAYTPSPANAAAWGNVVTAKINVLARSGAPSPGHSDDKTYALGLNANGTPNTVGPFNDAFKRHVFQTVIRLNNPAGRRQQ